MMREDKAKEISSLSENFGRAGAAFLVDFKGMSVDQVTTLRKKLFPLDSEMRVVRNTLALRALADHPKASEALKDSFVGNNAIVFAYGEAAPAAKAIYDYSKEVESLQLKVGLMDGEPLTLEAVKTLANLPSKDVLRAMLLGTLQGAASKFVRTLAAYKDKLEAPAGTPEA